MFERINPSILSDATNHLKLHTKQDVQEKFNVSFDKLFFKENKYRDNLDDLEFHIRIENNTPVENMNKNNSQEKIDNKNAREDAYQESSNKIEAKNEGKIKDKKTDENEIRLDSKIMQKRLQEKSKKEDLNENISVRLNIDENQKNVNAANMLKLKFVDLEPKVKEKIRLVINDLKSGKINDISANRFIAELIRGAMLKHFKNVNESKSLKIEVKSDKAELKKLFFNEKDNIKVDKSNGGEGNKGHFFQDNMLNKNNVKENNLKDKIFNKQDNTKNEKIDLKDFKSEVDLNINNGRMDNPVLNKQRVIEPQKLLEQNKQQLFQQITKNTKIMLSQNQTNFSTMIRPQEFGRIDFKFVIKDGKVNGKMILQNQETADFFRANIQELKAVFQKSNVELGNIDVILAGNRFGESGHDAGNNNNSNTFENDFGSFKNYNKEINNFEENNLFIDNNNYYSLKDKKVNVLI